MHTIASTCSTRFGRTIKLRQNSFSDVLALICMSELSCRGSQHLFFFGFKKQIHHRGSESEVKIPDFHIPAAKISWPYCNNQFVNKEGLSLHIKCVHSHDVSPDSQSTAHEIKMVKKPCSQQNH